ncbi:hypothetical protein PCO82_17005 [Pectobacteriaceae bacterium CE90]|nr:hypothetical protein PCO82_17005 [Pectobacteriaceae bacterium CE90]
MANFVTTESASLMVQVALINRQIDVSFNAESLFRLWAQWPHRLLLC